MGSGFAYKCEKCKKEYSVHLGIGMVFSNVYKSIMSDIKKGIYGEDFKNLSNFSQYVAVNPNRRVYICDHCVSWSLDYALDLYLPINTDEIAEKRFGGKNIDELGYVPYVVNDLLMTEYYKLLKRFVHKCPECGKKIREATEKELKDLPCPFCKTKGNNAGMLMWD